jgi:predicted dehydrogenase
LARYLLGGSCGEIESLTSRQILAQTLEKSKGGCDESAFTKLRFASGATADIVNSVVFRAPRSVEIYGSKGFAYCLDTLGPRGKGSITVNGAALDFAPQDPYEVELAHFVDCVKTGSLPVCDGSDGVANVDLLEQAVANQ